MPMAQTTDRPRHHVAVRLHVLSDLHLEHERFEPAAVDADVVVLAGDIGVGTRGVQWAQRWMRERPVLYVAGNHEFYGHALPDLVDELRGAAAGSSVSVLENSELMLKGVRFLGCTLWSDFDFDGPERRTQAMALCERMVNDYKHITFGPAARTLAPQDTRSLHVSSRRWLAARLAQPHDGPTVVVTHHAPLIRGRPSLPALRLIAGAFASDVTELMGTARVALWIFGHTHRAANLEIGRAHAEPQSPQHPVSRLPPA